VHEVILSPGTGPRFQSDTGGGTPMFARQIANRSLKSDRLPINQAKRQVDRDAPLLQVPIAPNPQFKTDCKPPIDVLGRCFADARVNYKVG
jgi:hypothetical protein